MKKVLVFLVLVLFALIIGGCSSSSSGGGDSSDIPVSTLNTNIESMASTGSSIGDTAISAIGISPRGVSALTTTYVSDGWWLIEDSVTSGSISYTRSYHARAYVGSSYVTPSNIGSVTSSMITKAQIYGSISISTGTMNMTQTLGSSASDYIEYDYSINKMNGTIASSGTYDGETFSVSMTFTNVTKTSSGMFGTITITLNGTSVATCVLNGTTGTLTYSGTYGSLPPHTFTIT
ncbi:MAG: hypothetical protein KKB81_03465 [Candidatus Margulisbacteria bacterium]|nr:hypothetical protein [Candidatus Margulisiibacteriota bacterium]MBU1021024.1 hypothetical protein [Candidatus Margulisiibacteriota bacterium]MBU1729609.1 hypothetical protein [Candidatus Margulisiibacteriota bacterium]MBU1956034.1 hypothetical protein [Candidatus Margulisiibacteriota bacterium]